MLRCPFLSFRKCSQDGSSTVRASHTLAGEDTALSLSFARDDAQVQALGPETSGKTAQSIRTVMVEGDTANSTLFNLYHTEGRWLVH